MAFSALKGNTLAQLVQSTRIYKPLRKWRAGIEGIISAAKRAFGLDRCTWRGYESFQAYVHLAVLGQCGGGDAIDVGTRFRRKVA